MKYLPSHDDLPAVWAQLAAQAVSDARTNIAFPGATDITHAELAELMTTVLFNNIGSPYDPGHGRNHTKGLERRVVDTVADLFRAPPSRWGYVTGGSTEGTEHALLDARRRYPDAVVYSSAGSHYKIPELTEKLLMPLVVIGTDDTGRINIDDLTGELARRRDRAAMIIAIAGTTMTEAVDDIPAIVDACDRLVISRRLIHVDAALSGIPLALLPDNTRPRFDFTVPSVTSIITSGHKFLSTLHPCGVLVYAEPPHAATAARVSYTGTANVTIPGSRSGHTTLLLAASLALGADRHRQRAEACRDTAAYAVDRLQKIGVDARRHPHGFTVFFPRPPAGLERDWVVAADDRHGHIICMPQVTREQVDDYVAAWTALIDTPRVPRRRRGAAVVRALIGG